MRGGHYDYLQYRLNDIAFRIEADIEYYRKEGGGYWGPKDPLPSDILEKMTETVEHLKKGEAMVQRIDWLLSGDDDESSFRERWKEEVEDKFK